MAAIRVTRYSWFWKKKPGESEYTVSWKNPINQVVCSMDVKIIGEEQELSSALSQAANDLKKMYPTVFKSMSDNEQAVVTIDMPSVQSLDDDGLEMERQDEDIVEFWKGGEEI